MIFELILILLLLCSSLINVTLFFAYRWYKRRNEHLETIIDIDVQRLVLTNNPRETQFRLMALKDFMKTYRHKIKGGFATAEAIRKKKVVRGKEYI